MVPTYQGSSLPLYRTPKLPPMSPAQTLARKPQKGLREASSERSPGAGSDELIQTSFRLPRSRWARLQQLGIEERMSIQSIIVAALEAEFQRRGKKF